MIFISKISVEQTFGLLPHTYSVCDENSVVLTELNFSGYMSQVFQLNESWFIIKKNKGSMVDSTQIADVIAIEEDTSYNSLPRIYLNPPGFFKHVFLKVIY